MAAIGDGHFKVDYGMDLDFKSGQIDSDGTHPRENILGNNDFVRNVGVVVRDLRSLGFTSMSEDAYASAIFLLLKVVCV